MRSTRYRSPAGFTLIEVVVSLAILGIGIALTLSLVSGALGNIRKVQTRARIIQHAETALETALLDASIVGPTTLNGDFEDGTRWLIDVREYEMPAESLFAQKPDDWPLKLLSYSVDVFGPESQTPDVTLHTLKVVNVMESAAEGGTP